jgi:hypothetical protein
VPLEALVIDSQSAMSIAFFGAAAAVAWAAAYAWAKWLAHRHDVAPPEHSLPADEAARLERMEAGLEILTLEVERLAEGQRYTSRLLEERLPRTLSAGSRGPLPEESRVITPH